VYRSSPPVPEVWRHEHFLPSAHRPNPLPSDGDTDESSTRLSSEFDENLSSADSEEIAGDRDRSPSVERDSSAGHPKAPRTTTRKRRAAISAGATSPKHSKPRVEATRDDSGTGTDASPAPADLSSDTGATLP